MAVIGNNADALLNTLSDFWRRFFRDLPDIQVMYEGAEILLGQTYLDLLHDVLSTSLVETPLFRKEYYRLITMREDHVRYEVVDHNDGVGRYVFTGDTSYGGIARLQDVIWHPSAALDEGVDYAVDGARIRFPTDITATPPSGFAWRTLDVKTGGKFTSQTVADWHLAGVQKGDVLALSSSVNLDLPDSAAWEALLEDPAMAKVRRFTVTHVTTDALWLDVDGPSPEIAANLSWCVMRQRLNDTWEDPIATDVSEPAPLGPFVDGRVEHVTTVPVKEVSFWAVDALVDEKTIYMNFGHYFTEERASSEFYRLLIRGLMQLYLLGPALQRMESALQLAGGLDIIRDDGEVLLGYDSGVLDVGTGADITAAGNVLTVTAPAFDETSVGGWVDILEAGLGANLGSWRIKTYLSPTEVMLDAPDGLLDDAGFISWRYSKSRTQTVTTSARTYTYVLDAPVKTAVKDPANHGVLTFRAFDTLTTAIEVVDYLSDPDWWRNMYIPQHLIEDRDTSWRQVTDEIFPTQVVPIGDTCIGDPGVYIGATEIGTDPATGEPQLVITNTPLHRKPSFTVLDRFMKAHVFSVRIDASALTADMSFALALETIREAKPVRTLGHVNPNLRFAETFHVEEEITGIGGNVLPVETLAAPDGTWHIGVGPDWDIGDTWAYDTATDDVVVNPGSDGIEGAVGGNHPLLYIGIPGASAPVSPPEANIFDRAVHALAYTP